MAENSTQPPHATRFVETTRGILSYAQLAPLLVERVLQVLQDIEDGVFATRPLDDLLLLDLHRNICGDLTPDWAGAFRETEVKVGQHSPPPSHQVPMLVRDYFADLNVRLADMSAGRETLLLESLAFAEGRLLFIHPFADFIPNSEVAVADAAGGTGHWPVPSGDPPPGTGRTCEFFRTSVDKAGSLPVPSGQWPDGTGESPVLPILILEFGLNGASPCGATAGSFCV